MHSSLRAVGRCLRTPRSIKSLSTVSITEQTSPKYPSRIGGVHYQEGDRVIVINKDGKRIKSRLIAPLKPDGTTRTGLHSYEIRHSDIIGKPAGRLYVNAKSSNTNDRSTSFRIAHPSLDQFVSLAPRTVTPIYSSYGATIVTLLDIHVAPPLPTNDPRTSGIRPLEILEAGTGNGGLTLHLARSIAAANPPPPYFETNAEEAEVEGRWNQWRLERRAIIHTVEFQKTRSTAAEKLIKSFRGALYWPHIDFHSGDVGTWVKGEHEERRQSSNQEEGFLDIVILDLPAVDRQIRHVVEAIKEDGQLVVWVPQITQIAACQRQIEHLGLPLKLDQAVELGEGVSNGRRWDVRFVKPRSEQKKMQGTSSADNTEDGGSAEDSGVDGETITSALEEEVSQSGADFPTMVCRPMVGELIMGGGFVGLWRKVPGKRTGVTSTQEQE